MNPNCGSVALSHKPHYLDCLEHCLHAPQAEKSSICKKAFDGWWSGAVR
jgi:hypothetical protein